MIFSLRMWLLAFGLCLSLGSCKKDEDANPREALVGPKWYTTDWYVVYKGQRNTDKLVNYPDCLRDNILIFAADGTYIWDSAGTKCDPRFPDTVPGEWQLSEKDTYLTMKLLDSPYPETFQIVEASSTTLVLSLQDPRDPQVQTVRRFKAL